MRFGTVAIIGRPNVGKTTLLNAALGQALAIVSPVPQTTRDALLGIAHRPTAQIAFIDTPGLHRPRSELGRRMNAAALEAARSCDVVVLMSDVGSALAKARQRKAAEPREMPLDPDDLALCELIAGEAPERVLVINKVDLLRDKAALLPLLQAFSAACPFSEMVPISARDPADVERVLALVESKLPEAAPAYDDETLTTAPTSFFVREYIREQILLGAKREVPHAVAVSIDRIEEDDSRMLVQATIHVDKPGQRKILVGRGGAMIREIGTHARQRIAELVQRKLRLELFVRVTPRWRDASLMLAELGHEPASKTMLPKWLDRTRAQRGKS
jgi:GTP-binding protein Era